MHGGVIRRLIYLVTLWIVHFVITNGNAISCFSILRFINTLIIYYRSARFLLSLVFIRGFSHCAVLYCVDAQYLNLIGIYVTYRTSVIFGWFSPERVKPVAKSQHAVAFNKEGRWRLTLIMYSIKFPSICTVALYAWKQYFECLGFWLSDSLNFIDLVYPRVYFGLISN